ncbi:MAG TPA: HAD-IC family P-type ATPase [Candidatus Limnocylindrales bacterium]|nr:HAD-IC family P-type ATPase [Candidatus Limnocylindrales bacterium]
MTSSRAVPPRVGARPAADPQRGLSTAEAEARTLAGEANEFHTPTSRSYLEIVRDNSYPFINGPLLLVSLALIGFGATTEAVMTGLPVFLNIAIGVVQGSRAKRQLDRVALLSEAPATVVRDGVERQVPPAAVVLGDVVVANRGDEIQLDGRIVGDATASVDESALTGESNPIHKSAGDTVQSGSAVLSGVARYEVEAVGADTYANRILAQAKGRRVVRTPLQSEIARTFIVVGALIALAAGVVVLTLPTAITDAAQETVFAAAVLITLVPQGLALMLTVTYAAAALRISRLGALTQRPSAIEAISRIDTFCTDKTGTLTTQQITFRDLRRLVTAGMSTADLERVVAAVAASGTTPNRTTYALATAFPGPGLAVAEEIPFSSALRWSAIRFAAGDAHHPASAGTWLLGAPSVLAPAMRDRADEVRSRATASAETGQRVLVLARASAGAALAVDDQPRLPDRLEPIALLTFEEELRPEAPATIDGLRARGIDVKIVSGDDPVTVQAIGRRLGLGGGTNAASGLDLADLGDDELADLAIRTTIFGRVDPHLKARLVTVLKRRGRFVAMTGDGVNDILPVRIADVGVAMQSGSPATRGVADLVLVRDDFSILPEAIRDGQRIVAAMAATLTVLLARTFYVLLIIVGAALLQLPFPFTPRQNSILALVTVGVPILVLALWVRPVPSRSGLLGQTLRISIPLSLGVAAVGLPVYADAIAIGAPTDVARTMLTTMATFLGIGALVLIPIAADDSGRIRMPARVRTALLVGGLVVAYLAVLATDAGRDIFQLSALPIGIHLSLGLIALAWTGAVVRIHRTRIVARVNDRLVLGWRRFVTRRPAGAADASP